MASVFVNLPCSMCAICSSADSVIATPHLRLDVALDVEADANYEVRGTLYKQGTEGRSSGSNKLSLHISRFLENSTRAASSHVESHAFQPFDSCEQNAALSQV